jgi:hypothetical protein
MRKMLGLCLAVLAAAHAGTRGDDDPCAKTTVSVKNVRHAVGTANGNTVIQFTGQAVVPPAFFGYTKVFVQVDLFFADTEEHIDGTSLYQRTYQSDDYDWPAQGGTIDWTVNYSVAADETNALTSVPPAAYVARIGVWGSGSSSAPATERTYTLVGVVVP